MSRSSGRGRASSRAGRARREASASEAVRFVKGGDVLNTGPNDSGDGWEQDLRSQHGVISVDVRSRSKQVKSFECQLCGVWLPSWAQVSQHCRGEKHQKKKASTDRPPEVQEWALMRHYAENGELDDIDAKLRAGAVPNATGPGDDRTPLFWAAWGGHDKVIRRRLEEPRARDLAMKKCKGLGRVPEKPLSPLEVAHDRCGRIQSLRSFRCLT